MMNTDLLLEWQFLNSIYKRELKKNFNQRQYDIFKIRARIQSIENQLLKDYK